MQPKLRELLYKYNMPGPRYTSYPTVPAWHNGVGPQNYRDSLVSLMPGETLSLYLHLPFCERLCHFCGCMQVITKDRSRSQSYVQRLLQELTLVLKELPQATRQVTQLHFGGGTPNFLQPSELEEIMSRLRNEFDFTPEAEIAIEMHPRTSTSEFCEKLSELGFNRISLGIQDFDPRVQELIHRNQTYEQTSGMINQLRRLGFASFNFDLIYGLPGQNLESWAKTLDLVWKLKPNRLAVYSYAHVPWMRPVQRSFKDEDLPDPQLKLALFETAYHFFLEHGYQPIGMDHFALAEDELAIASENGTLHRNFMGYSTRAEAHQLGFGVSAISYVGGNYFQNQKELPAYETAIQENRLPTFRGYLLNRDDALRRDLITRIMCLGRVEFENFEKKWNISFSNYFSDALDRLSSLLEDGLVRINPFSLEARGEGRLFLRNIAMAFDAYLQDIQKNSKNPTFSKTV